MNKIYILLLSMAALATAAHAQQHTQIVGLTLGQPAAELAQALHDKGLQLVTADAPQPASVIRLTGRVAGLDALVSLYADSDTAATNCLMLTTQRQQGRTLRDDYKALRQWMQKHHGAPQWEGTVRSHPFARWYVGFDRDIVLIATATPSVEIWFYDNHKHRNIDYYSILKYCERYPADGVPYMTAREQVTWKSSAPPAVSRKRPAARNHRKSVRRNSRHPVRRRHSARRRRR